MNFAKNKARLKILKDGEAKATGNSQAWSEAVSLGPRECKAPHCREIPEVDQKKQ